MKNRYAAVLLAVFLLILAVIVCVWMFSDNRVLLHTLPQATTPGCF